MPSSSPGLRPGEKLHEQLFYDHEAVEPTDVAKVLRAQAAPPPTDIRTRVVELLSWAGSDTDLRLRNAAFRLVEDLGDAATEEFDAAAADHQARGNGHAGATQVAAKG